MSRLSAPQRCQRSGLPDFENRAIGSFHLVPTAKSRTFFLRANTFEGDSGGPVYLSRSSPDKEEVRLILGVVTRQQFLEEDMKMIYGQIKLKHRLGLAILVHASFSKETIDSLP